MGGAGTANGKAPILSLSEMLKSAAMAEEVREGADDDEEVEA